MQNYLTLCFTDLRSLPLSAFGRMEKGIKEGEVII
jgi:hypothetical protein